MNDHDVNHRSRWRYIALFIIALSAWRFSAFLSTETQSDRHPERPDDVIERGKDRLPAVAITSSPALLDTNRSTPATNAGQSLTAARPSIPPASQTTVQPVPADWYAARTFGSRWGEEPSPDLRVFSRWAGDYVALPPAERRSLLQRGVELAQARRDTLAALIRSDPAQAIAVAVPYAIRQQLPIEVKALLEERISGRGQLSTLAATPLPGQKIAEPVWQSVLLEGREFRAYTYGQRKYPAAPRTQPLHGVAVGNALAVLASPLRVLDRGEVPGQWERVEAVCPVSGITSTVIAGAPLNEGTSTAVSLGDRIVVLCGTHHLPALEAKVALASGPSVADGPGSSGVLGRPSVSWTTGPKRILIIRVDFSDYPGEPTTPYTSNSITPSFITNVIHQAGGVREFYEKSSFGQTTLVLGTNDITPVLRLPQTAVYYATNSFLEQLHSDARSMANSNGWDTASYDRVGVVLDYLGSIVGTQLTYAGYGNLYGGNFWICGFFDDRVVSHELGHTYGLLHANRWQTTDGSTLGTTADLAVSPLTTNYSSLSIEYGDGFDTMGGSSPPQGQFNHWFKNLLNWTPDSSVLSITNSGVYRVYRFDRHDALSAAGPLALKVARDSDRDYWIGYRRLFTGSSYNIADGAYVLWGYHYVRQSDLLVMNNPATNNVNTAALTVGQTFTDGPAGITFSTLAQGGVAPNEYLDIRVALASGAPPGNAPSFTSHPQSLTVSVGYPATFTAAVTGALPQTYQWRFNGTDLSGATNSSYIVASVQSNQAGIYNVLASNSSGTATSYNAVLTVTGATIPYTFVTLAGTLGGSIEGDGTGSAARFSSPSGVAVDSKGNIYVADTDKCTIRKITSAGAVTTFAGLAGQYGSADGTNSTARFGYPRGVAVDNAGNVYVADHDNHMIRKITSVGVVTTLAGLAGESGIADGTNSAARFSGPSGVTVDSMGNVYVADAGNQTIRKITSGGVVTTFAGLAGQSGSANGTNSQARFYYPEGVTVDSVGNVYVADQANFIIRKINPAGVVTTLAGRAGYAGSQSGTNSTARFYYPSGVTVDSAGNVWVADTFNHIIRKITPDGVVTTPAGLAGQSGSADGTNNAARFNQPSGVAVDSSGNIYVADTGNYTIRKITPEGVTTTLAGLAGEYTSPTDGTGGAARFNQPNDVALDSAGNVYVADAYNSAIRKITPAGIVTTLAGRVGAYGSTDGTNDAARFSYPNGVAVDSTGNVYVADSNNQTIRKITSVGVVTTLAGLAGESGNADGTNSTARFYQPNGVAVDGVGNIYVADTYNNTIRKITPSGVVTTFAGQAGQGGGDDGNGSTARFNSPFGIALDKLGNVYVAEIYGATIRKITPVGVVTTLAGRAYESGSADGGMDDAGSAARFNSPRGLAVDDSGNVFVADYGNNTIRMITPAGDVTTLGGLAGQASGRDGSGITARFSSPVALPWIPRETYMWPTRTTKPSVRGDSRR